MRICVHAVSRSERGYPPQLCGPPLAHALSRRHARASRSISRIMASWPGRNAAYADRNASVARPHSPWIDSARARRHIARHVKLISSSPVNEVPSLRSSSSHARSAFSVSPISVCLTALWTNAPATRRWRCGSSLSPNRVTTSSYAAIAGSHSPSLPQASPLRTNASATRHWRCGSSLAPYRVTTSLLAAIASRNSPPPTFWVVQGQWFPP